MGVCEWVHGWMCMRMCVCMTVCLCVQGDELSRLQREWAEEKLQLTSHSSKLQTELAGKESQLNMAAERLIQVTRSSP